MILSNGEGGSGVPGWGIVERGRVHVQSASCRAGQVREPSLSVSALSEPLKSPTQLNIRNTPTANRIQLGPDLFLAGMGGVLVPAP